MIKTLTSPALSAGGTKPFWRKVAAWFSAIIIIAGLLGMCLWQYGWIIWSVPVERMQMADGTQMKFRTHGEQIEIYRDGAWHPYFLQGVNMGTALPGHFPGELAISKETYMEWFQMISDMGANVIRIYTIHPPRFYEALVEYNKRHSDNPLYFIQGIWSPEEALIEKQDAYDNGITESFREEISQAVGAVYGDINIPPKPGKASGKYTANAGPYLVAWHVGTEWDPNMVENTDKLHAGVGGFKGEHFRAKTEASPFENWLAKLLDTLASEEKPHGWEHPVTFTNWVTTDPLHHPGEPFFDEDKVSVDATHIAPVNWQAGYFASFHVYPYYPDFFRLDKTLRNVRNDEGKPDPYKAYLRQLKSYHAGMPIIVAEFGVPSSSGLAHLELLNRTQGGHNEAEQGKIDAALFREIVEEKYAGALVFSWQDEWFKKTWNTMDYEDPARKPYWLNVLSNEEMFGVLGMYSGKDGILKIDGREEDWKALKDEEKMRLDKRSLNFGNSGIADMWVTHDEAYIYMLIKLDHPFDPAKQTLYIGTDTLPGGNVQAQQMDGITLDEGLETLISLGNDEQSEIRIASNYDFHTRLYGQGYRMLPVNEQEMRDNSGVFKTWKLAVGLLMEPPDAKFYHPFEEVTVGNLIRGTTDPDSPDYNSLALWNWQDNTIELRIPWMLLGFSDPSTHQAISYKSSERKRLTSEISPGIRLIPWLKEKNKPVLTGQNSAGKPFPVSKIPPYQWENWDQVTYQVRKKQSYAIIQDAFLENRKNRDQQEP